MKHLIALPLEEALKILDEGQVSYIIKKFPELNYRFPLSESWRVINMKQLSSGEWEILAAREQEPDQQD